MIERAILEAAANLRRAGEPYLIATLVGQRGSAYRRAGARLILAHDRRVAGEVSGGCLEGDLARRGWWRTRDREPVVVTYDSRHDDDAPDDEIRAAFAVGCNGVVDVMLERAGDARDAEGASDGHDRLDVLAFAERCMRAQRRGAVATIYRTSAAMPGAVGARMARCDRVSVDAAFPADADLRAAIAADLAGAIASGASADRTYAARAGRLEVFVEAMVPPPRLFVFGSGPDAAPLVDLARALGWEAIACARSLRPALRDRFVRADALIAGSPGELARQVDAAARAVAVVMAHDYELDRAHLDALLASRALYIGVLGPRKRTDRMLADLGRDRGRRSAIARADRPRARRRDAARDRARDRRRDPGGRRRRAAARLARSPRPDPRPRRARRARGGRRVRIAAAVLAAGGSRRLGHPKQLVPHGASTVVRETVRCALAACDPVAVVLGSSADEVALALDGLIVDLVANFEWQDGVATSIREAATWAQRVGVDALALFVCDQPRLTIAHVRVLVATHRASRAPVASRYAGVLGVPAVFVRAQLAALRELTGDAGARTLLADDPSVVAVDWPDGAIDIDTASDLAYTSTELS